MVRTEVLLRWQTGILIPDDGRAVYLLVGPSEPFPDGGDVQYGVYPCELPGGTKGQMYLEPSGGIYRKQAKRLFTIKPLGEKFAGYRKVMLSCVWIFRIDDTLRGGKITETETIPVKVAKPCIRCEFRSGNYLNCI